ncbi:hypoxia up-regulated protein 1, partial [Elysia marginata]
MATEVLRTLFLAVILSVMATSVNARVAVMSIDLGGEFMKIAIVKPGVPMEIVLNKESSRKTPTLVAFRDGERQFGNEAQSTAVKFPAKAFAYLPLIVGKQYDDPQVALFRERFPYYKMEKDEERSTVLFRTDNDSVYSVEELLAMILEKAKEYAQDFAEQDIKDAVITVPSFFNQAERRSVMAAAKMVGINVLQLMSDNAAVALNYGVFRRNNFNTTMQYYMFYDMGSTSTTATIVGYNVVKTKEGTRVESNPQVTIKGVGFDRTLGGLEISLRLRKFLAKAFNDQKKTTLQVEENPRAMAKLLKEAERVKKVLSANVDHTAQVEGLLDEKDFRSPVTRAELEHLSEDLFERVTKPIDEALKASEITLPEISEVILMGGATRMPKVQETLVKYLGRSDLGKSINTDEAAAMGSVYQAAYLGKGFKVKKFGVREANIYPINVEFEKQKSEESDEPARTIKRTLFGRMNPFPQRKVMTFNKHTKDFGFNVTYSGLDFLTEDDKRSFGKLLISKFNLQGVEDALTKNKDVAESKGIKAHFQMDGSGILFLDKVESVFEKNDTEQEKEKSTWSKLGSAIGGLFGGGNANEDTKIEESSEDETTPEESTGDSTEAKEEQKADTADNADTAAEKEEQTGDKKEETTEEQAKEKEEPKEKEGEEKKDE